MIKKLFFNFLFVFSILSCKAQNINATFFIGYHASNYIYAATSGTRKIEGSYHLGMEGNIELSELNRLGLGVVFLNDLNTLKRNFIYKNIPSFFDNPKVEERYKLQWIKVPVSFIHCFKKNDNLFYSTSLIAKFNVNAIRNGTAYLAGFTEKYADKFKIDTENGKHLGLAFGASIGMKIPLKTSKFITRLFFESDISKWRYPSNFELEKEVYYPFRAISMGIDIGYNF